MATGTGRSAFRAGQPAASGQQPGAAVLRSRGRGSVRALARAVLLLMALPFPARAQTTTASAPDSAIESQVRTIAQELRCPVCQGLSIEASPTELSVQMKGVIREQLQSGKSPEEVKAYFVDKYGEWILLQPPAKGFNLAVYLLPAAVLLGGLAFVIVMLRRWTARAADDPEAAEAALHTVPDLD